MKANSRGVIGGVAAAAILTVAIVSTAGHEGTGAKGPPSDRPLPPFAAPLAVSRLTGDVNISPAACSVQLAGALTSCEAAARTAVAIGFVTVADSQCARLARSLSVLSASSKSRIGQPVRAVLVGLRGERKPLAGLAARTPGVNTVWDRSGVLANRYGIAVCPSVVIAARGGRVLGTVIGDDANRPDFLVQRTGDLLGGPIVDETH